MISNDIKATVLTQALPYIKNFNKKIIVVKYGGNAMVNESLKQTVMSDIVLLSLVGIKVVLVHGGGPEISEQLKKIGKESKFINGLRYTDKETADVAQMVLAGKINKDLVALIGKEGGRAIGVCGIDDHMFNVEPVKTNVDLGYVGEIKSVNTYLIETLLASNLIPVVATVGLDSNGQVFNINADTAAAALAVSLKAEKIILMTDIPGLLKNIEDSSSLIPLLKLSEVSSLIKKGVIKGGMLPKVDCCVKAVREGVKTAVMIDGRISHSILIEMMTDSGVGTMIKGDYDD